MTTNRPENSATALNKVGVRVREQRIRKGFSLRGLATECGLSYSRISRIERNVASSIELIEIFRLAKALNVEATWILEGSPIRDRIVAAARTSRAEEVDQAVDKLVDIFEIDAAFNEVGVPDRQKILLDKMPRNADQSPRDWGIETATRVRQDWGLQSGPLHNLISLIEKKTGVYVAIDDLGEEVDGVCLVDPENGVTIIAASTRTPWERQRFTLAHELGHLLAGELRIEAVEKNRPSKAETAAHEFARNLLIPIQDLIVMNNASGGKVWDKMEIATLAWQYQVSSKVAAIQLGRANIIADHLVEEISDSGAKLWSTIGGWESERDAEAGCALQKRRPARLVRRAIKGWEIGLVSTKYIAKATSQSEDDVAMIMPELIIDQEFEPELIAN